MVSVRRELRVEADIGEISHVAAREFVRQSTNAIQTKGYCAVALSGGSTPQNLYRLLAGDQYRGQVRWSKVHLFWCDERCVPPDHYQSNYRMVRELLLDKIPVPPGNIYRIPAEYEDHNRAAEEYEQTLKTFFHLKNGELPRFDLVLLGMGDDGHTASLFPETDTLEETRRLVAATYIKKLNGYRITLTVPVINQAAYIIFLISGESKSAVLKKVLEGELQPGILPSQYIRPVEGRLLFLADRAAAARLENV
ncbi:MAG: 6-phosphogluconolactonase [Candidatus Loosdrechtia sp.]|uniref:6-phosphogluconolactonase n=1 Tax=Candidatus Loosdrechtia sp. TaxID=3101272 RepID=UPI003A739707|nr:MAG: 6-phosphogluconolactonase [Candidatus Jettenia sp. AMX2]